jgi:uncharacterized BrkB/YihY/UPF0761 family membrane protein
VVLSLLVLFQSSVSATAAVWQTTLPAGTSSTIADAVVSWSPVALLVFLGFFSFIAMLLPPLLSRPMAIVAQQKAALEKEHEAEDAEEKQHQEEQDQAEQQREAEGTVVG